MRRRFLLGAHAVSVGSGVARTIQAAEQPQSESTDAWVQFCVDAGQEAFEEVIQNPPTLVTKRTGERHEGWEAIQHFLAEGTWPTEQEDSSSGYLSEPMQGQELRLAAELAASTAFKCCMPPLTGRARAKAYVACVVAGLQRGYFKGPEAKAMLHGAQLALIAHPKRHQTPRSTRAPAGFRPRTPHPTPQPSTGDQK